MHGLDDLSRRIAAAAQAATRQALEEVLTQAQALCPVDSGELRQSLHLRMSDAQTGAAGEVVADAPHASYVEMGTFLRPAQPFLQPALAQVRPRVTAMLIRQLSGS
ncbi:MAG: hypothetical protein E7319_05330 [Clostridiales bacterium]|nr:hypothetical protein [Clostridiales bacterium]